MGVLLNAEDRQAMKLMFTHSKRLPSGHYQVPVLWKGDRRPPNNRVEALKEWKRNLARLKDTGLHEEFDKIINHWLEEGYVEKLPNKAVLDKQAFYLPTRTPRATLPTRPPWATTPTPTRTPRATARKTTTRMKKTTTMKTTTTKMMTLKLRFRARTCQPGKSTN